ncbi:hypothetical protein TALC_00303 [Thermoplasmatales archaeon BRNA1]|nr:hypothetical protein TALC_00303 [Thermoplasmatales archaeon BRNA1]
MPILSIKSGLLKRIYEAGGPVWEDELVKATMEAEGVFSDYWKWTIRYYMMEMLANGMIDAVEYKLGDESNFGSEHSIAKYQINDFGKMKVESMLL